MKSSVTTAAGPDTWVDGSSSDKDSSSERTDRREGNHLTSNSNSSTATMESPSPSPAMSSSTADALAWYKSQYEQLESELTEFKESSLELERELEKDIVEERVAHVLV